MELIINEILHENLLKILFGASVLVYGAMQITFEYRIGKRKINPLWRVIDRMERERSEERLIYENRFTRLETSSDHLEDHLKRLDSKIEGIDQKIDTRHAELNQRLDGWFGRSEK